MYSVTRYCFSQFVVVIVLAKDTKASAEDTIKGNREEIHSLAWKF